MRTLFYGKTECETNFVSGYVLKPFTSPSQIRLLNVGNKFGGSSGISSFYQRRPKWPEDGGRDGPRDKGASVYDRFEGTQVIGSRLRSCC